MPTKELEKGNFGTSNKGENLFPMERAFGLRRRELLVLLKIMQIWLRNPTWRLFSTVFSEDWEVLVIACFECMCVSTYMRAHIDRTHTRTSQHVATS